MENGDYPELVKDKIPHQDGVKQGGDSTATVQTEVDFDQFVRFSDHLTCCVSPGYNLRNINRLGTNETKYSRMD